MAIELPTPPAPPAPPAPPEPPVMVDGGNGSTTEIRNVDGKTVITKTDSDGMTKTVTVEGLPGLPAIANGHHPGVTVLGRDDELPSIRPDGVHGMHGWMIVLAIVAMVMFASIMKTAVRAKYGDERRSAWGRHKGATAAPLPDARREIDLLAGENEKLRAQIGRLEERVSVLERIVTDPARRVAAEIDALR